MRARVRLLARLRAARQRVRDMAAGSALVADGRRRDAATARDAAADHEIDMLVDAAERFSEIDDARALLMFETERSAAQYNRHLAEKALDAARREADAQAAKLRGKERELRVTERVLDTARQEVARREQRAEQSMSDDLAAARLRRRA